VRERDRERKREEERGRGRGREGASAGSDRVPPAARRPPPHRACPRHQAGVCTTERRGNNLIGVKHFRTENGSSQGRNLVLTGLFVPNLLDRVPPAPTRPDADRAIKLVCRV